MSFSISSIKVTILSLVGRLLRNTKWDIGEEIKVFNEIYHTIIQQRSIIGKSEIVQSSLGLFLSSLL